MNNIADDLARAFNDGSEKGKSDAEAHIFHCGDTDEPQTNADRIRSMTDDELADFLDRWQMGDIDYSKTFCDLCAGQYDCRDDCLLGWLKQEAE